MTAINPRYPYMICRVDESDRAFYKRAFNYAMSQVDRHYRLQAMRITEGYFGAATFYQSQAARWYERAMECRNDYLALLETLIPFTDVRFDYVFPNSIRFMNDMVEGAVTMRKMVAGSITAENLSLNRNLKYQMSKRLERQIEPERYMDRVKKINEQFLKDHTALKNEFTRNGRLPDNERGYWIEPKPPQTPRNKFNDPRKRVYVLREELIGKLEAFLKR